MPAVVGLLSVELHLADAQSLKDKRMVVRSVVDRLKRLNVAVAEVEYQDLWQRAGISVAAVSASGVQVERALAAALEAIECVHPGLVVRSETEILE